MIYPSDCISLSPFFGEPHIFKFHRSFLYSSQRTFEFQAGMMCGEFGRASEMHHNAISLQPSLAVAFKQCTATFRPPEGVLQTAYDLYSSNMDLPTCKRIRFDSFEWPAASECTFFACENIDTVYTKHPITGEVTMHAYPFPHLPKFTVNMVHPAFLTLQAMRFHLRACTVPFSETLHQLLHLLGRHVPPSFAYDADPSSGRDSRPVKSPICVKRKTLEDAKINLKPKRQRILPIARPSPALGKTRLQTRMLSP